MFWRKDNGGGAKIVCGNSAWVFSVWNMMCLKDGVRKVVCDKAVGKVMSQRWCVTMMCVKHKVWQTCVWKTVCQRWWVTSCVCEQSCVKDCASERQGFVKDNLRRKAVSVCDVRKDVDLWWVNFETGVAMSWYDEAVMTGKWVVSEMC